MLLVSKYTSIKQLVYSRIVTFLSISFQKENFFDWKADGIVRVEKREKYKLLYRSALGFRLSKACGVGVLEIAENVASHLAIDANEKWLVQVKDGGWIEIEILPGLVAAWLQGWVAASAHHDDQHQQLNCLETDAMQFDAQYAHARCYGLVRLAMNQGIISTVDSETQIPWCDRDMLRFQQPAEWDFLGNLIDVTDAIACEEDASVQCWQKYAQGLSKGFERFWRECNIFGITKVHNPELVLARLGLIIVAQQVLQQLLETKLHQRAVFSL